MPENTLFLVDITWTSTEVGNLDVYEKTGNKQHLLTSHGLLLKLVTNFNHAL